MSNTSIPIPGFRCVHCHAVNVIDQMMILTLEDAIISFLKRGDFATSRSEIEEKFHTSSPATIKNVLTRLRQQGKIIHVGHGVWRGK